MLIIIIIIFFFERDTLINLKTNKYMIIKEWKKRKRKKNTSVPRKVGMLEYASQSKGLHGYSKHNCFCRKNLTIHVGGCL